MGNCGHCNGGSRSGELTPFSSSTLAGLRRNCSPPTCSRQRYRLKLLRAPCTGSRPGKIFGEAASARRYGFPVRQCAGSANCRSTTLARSMVGHNEDKAEHMGIAIANAQVLQRTFGCHVMLVHHTGKANNGPRGSVALPAACETEILVTRDDDIITMKCIKQKDGDEFTDLKFTLKVVPLPTAGPADDFATNTSSCVLVDYAPADSGANGQLAKADRDVLNVFASFTPGEQVRNADIKKASGYMGGTLTRSLDRLEKLGYICKSGTGVGTRYWLKTRGECQEIPENSGTDDGTADECTEVDQLDRRDNQNGTHGP